MTRRSTTPGSPSLPTSVATVASADGTAISVLSVGRGPSVIVVGGSMRTAADYLPLASGLTRDHQVHILERRGRGASGPLGADYRVQRECEDLLAVQAATGATAVFGHSCGGLVVLETARRNGVFDSVAVYEPAVSIGGSIPTAWTTRYRELLDAGRPRTAFAYFVQQSGHAPAAVTRLPLWYLTAVMRVVVRKRQWKQFVPLLHTIIPEHEQVRACDDDISRFAGVSASVLLLAGRKSPAFTGAALLNTLHGAIANSRVDVIAGLDHNAPDEKNPAAVARRLDQFLPHT